MLDLTKEEDAYFYGLLLTDGNLYFGTRNRGKVTLELSDEDIIRKLSLLYSGSFSERVRNTNFMNNYHSYVWRNYRIEFREELLEYGFPIKEKDLNQKIPLCDFDTVGFWRGIIDGNGSLGLTDNDIPFISLATKSEELKNSYLDFLYLSIGEIKNISRNKRDNIYNISSYRTNAIKLSRLLYENAKIFIDRKHKKYLELDTFGIMTYGCS